MGDIAVDENAARFRARAARRNGVAANVDSDIEGGNFSASDRKILSLRTSPPKRKWTSSIKLVFPAPLRDCRSVAPALLSASRIFSPALKRKVLKEVTSLPKRRIMAVLS
jgi:hypothetical protein